jgi:hypothetical protein
MLAMHLVPSILGSKIQPLLEKILPEAANIGFIGIMNIGYFSYCFLSVSFGQYVLLPDSLYKLPNKNIIIEKSYLSVSWIASHYGEEFIEWETALMLWILGRL